MSATASQLTLTKPQWDMLVYVRWIGADGHAGARGDAVLCALERRGLIDYRGTRAKPNVQAWHATDAGRDLLAANDSATEVITPSSVWRGKPVEGSRWSEQQLQVLQREGRDPTTVPTATIGRRAKVHPTDWTMPPPVVKIILPCLARTRDRLRAKVITPAGATQWLDVLHG